MKWTENTIAGALARQFFERKHLVLVPNCTWTGHECDLLVVCRDLRLIDVEIKISRADFKADAKKDKWWASYRRDPVRGYVALNPSEHRAWPPKVWKHYYCMPAEIWTPDLLPFLGSQSSGVLLLSEGRDGQLAVKAEKRCMPNKDADRIAAGDAIDIARLASLRMWDALGKLEQKRAAPLQELEAAL